MKILKILFWIIVSLTLLAGGIAALVWHLIFSPAINISEPIQFVVNRQDNLQSIAERLSDGAGLEYPQVFMLLAQRMNVEKNLRPGKFEIKPGMNNRELAILFRKGGTYTVDVVIRGSQDVRKIAKVLSDKIEPAEDEIQALLNDNKYLSNFGFDSMSVAAMFIPNTYNMYWYTTADEVLTKLHQEYLKFWDSTKKAKADSLGLSPLQVAVLASIIDKETNQVDEMPMIAGVYLNRLKNGWKLQADPTVKFALDSMSMTRIYNSDTKIEHPFNTYFIDGLPPSPICIPSVQSQEAVLNYTKHNFMYFCARPDFSGYHVFAVSLDAHNRNAAIYHKFLNKLEKEKNANPK